MKFLKYMVGGIFALVLSGSCEKALLIDETEAAPTSTFEYFWNAVDEQYSYFEQKNINWDSVYTATKPKINDKLSNEAFFAILSDMLKTLRDGHVNLVSPFNVWSYNIEKGYYQNYNARLLRDYYLDNESDSLHTTLQNGTSFRVQERAYNTMPIPNQICFINNLPIGYIRYGSFAYTISEQDLDYVFERMKNCEAVIIDIRDNGGGDPENLFRLLSRFVKEKKYMYTSLLKNGHEHNAFTGAKDIFLDAHNEKNVPFYKPVKILTNRSCYSASSFFAAAARSFAADSVDITLIGDYTGGGAGAPGGGQLPNGWYYRLSVTQTAIKLNAIDTENLTAGISAGMVDSDNNLFHFEDGVPPHILIDYNAIDHTSGRDKILETAFINVLEELVQ